MTKNEEGRARKVFAPDTRVAFLWKREGDDERIYKDDRPPGPDEKPVVAEVTRISSKDFTIVEFLTEPRGHRLTIQEHNFPLLREVTVCAIDTAPRATGG